MGCPDFWDTTCITFAVRKFNSTKTKKIMTTKTMTPTGLTNLMMQSLFHLADRLCQKFPTLVNAPLHYEVPPERRPVIVFGEE